MVPRAVRAWLAGRTSTQLASGMAVLTALALTAALWVTGLAVRMDQREKAALQALADYSAMVLKLGADPGLDANRVTQADADYLSAWLAAFQSGPARDARSLEETCRTGRGGAGVRFIQAPGGKAAGVAALGTVRAERQPRLGDDVYLIKLGRGVLCPGRPIEVVAVRRDVGALSVIVGRIVERSGEAWGRAVLAVALGGVVILVSGLAASTFARRRLTSALAQVSQALDRAAVGDFSHRAPEVGVAPELTELTHRVNLTLDRLEELLTWLRDSSDQLAHDFRTPLARASARLDRLGDATSPQERTILAAEARRDLAELTRAMNEAMVLRDGEAWVFEPVRLDELARAAAELYQPLAEAREIVILAEGPPIEVLGVRSLLQRAVANLVDNAVKFSPDGGRVTIRAFQADGRPCLSVADQGPGLDPALAERGGVPARDREDSHGMGLAFVRATLRRHGGRMTIDDARPGAVVTACFSG